MCREEFSGQQSSLGESKLVFEHSDQNHWSIWLCERPNGGRCSEATEDERVGLLAARKSSRGLKSASAPVRPSARRAASVAATSTSRLEVPKPRTVRHLMVGSVTAAGGRGSSEGAEAAATDDARDSSPAVAAGLKLRREGRTMEGEAGDKEGDDEAALDAAPDSPTDCNPNASELSTAGMRLEGDGRMVAGGTGWRKLPTGAWLTGDTMAELPPERTRMNGGGVPTPEEECAGDSGDAGLPPMALGAATAGPRSMDGMRLNAGRGGRATWMRLGSGLEL